MAQSEEYELALFMVSAYVPNFDSKSTEVEVIDDDVEPEEELQLGVAKAALVGEPIQLKEECECSLRSARGTSSTSTDDVSSTQGQQTI